MNLFLSLLNQKPAEKAVSTSSLLSSDFTSDMRIDARAGKLHLSAAKTQEFQIGEFGLEELNATEGATANQEFISNLLEAAKAKGIDAKAVVVVMPNAVSGNKPKYFSNGRLQVKEGEGVTSTIEVDNNFNLFAQLSEAVIGVEEDGKPTAVISVLDFNLVKAFTEEELMETAKAIAEQYNLEADKVYDQISVRYNLPYFYTKKKKGTVEEGQNATEVSYQLRSIELVNLYFVTDVVVAL